MLNALYQSTMMAVVDQGMKSLMCYRDTCLTLRSYLFLPSCVEGGGILRDPFSSSDAETEDRQESQMEAITISNAASAAVMGLIEDDAFDVHEKAVLPLGQM